MGNLGIATSFFNEKNRNIVSDLVELLIETNQELPGFLEEMANDRFGAPRRGNSRGNARYGGSGFGSRDYRQPQQRYGSGGGASSNTNSSGGGANNRYSQNRGGGYGKFKYNLINLIELVIIIIIN